MLRLCVESMEPVGRGGVMKTRPHATFVDADSGLIHLSDGSAREIGSWLDHCGEPFDGEPTPENIRWVISKPDATGVMMVDLQGAAYGVEPEGRA